MALANVHAMRNNSEYIGAEHILLGLIYEGGGTGVRVLREMGVDLKKIRLKTESVIKSGPEIVSMGRLPINLEANGIVLRAETLSGELGHDYVGTEHLVGALIDNGGKTIQGVFRECGVGRDQYCAGLSTLLAENKQLDQPDVYDGVTQLTIPADRLNVVELVKLFGFHPKENGDNVEVNTAGKEIVGLIPIRGRNPSRYGTPTVIYWADKAGAVDFRDVLDTQRINYNEDPSRAEVARRVRQEAGIDERITDAMNLADRIERTE